MHRCTSPDISSICFHRRWYNTERGKEEARVRVTPPHQHTWQGRLADWVLSAAPFITARELIRRQGKRGGNFLSSHLYRKTHQCFLCCFLLYLFSLFHPSFLFLCISHTLFSFHPPTSFPFMTILPTPPPPPNPPLSSCCHFLALCSFLVPPSSARFFRPAPVAALPLNLH